MIKQAGLTVDRVWGACMVSGGGHVVKKTEAGVLYVVPCDFPAPALKLTMRADDVELYDLFGPEQLAQLLHSLTLAYDA